MNESARQNDEKKKVTRVKSLMDSIKSRKDFLKLNQKNILAPGMSFVTFGTWAKNIDDPKWHDVFFDADLMTLPEKKYYENAKLTDDFKKLLQLFFETIEVDHPEKRAQVVYQFEESLSKIYPTPEVSRKRYGERRITSRAKI